MDRKNYRNTAASRLAPAYKEKLKIDTYTFFAAGLQEDIRRQALGGPTPPGTCELLLTAAGNAELEKRKATAKPKYLSEISGEPEGAAWGELSAAFQLSELRAEIAALKSQFATQMSSAGIATSPGISRLIAHHPRRRPREDSGAELLLDHGGLLPGLAGR